jgi:hypothetical protein
MSNDPLAPGRNSKTKPDLLKMTACLKTNLLLQTSLDLHTLAGWNRTART